jgi:glycine hydroxymethyltransferase
MIFAGTIRAAINKAYSGNAGRPLMHVSQQMDVCLEEAFPKVLSTIRSRCREPRGAGKKLMENGIGWFQGLRTIPLMLVDLTDKGITGKDLEAMLDAPTSLSIKTPFLSTRARPFITSGIALERRPLRRADGRSGYAAMVRDLRNCA